MFRLLSSHRQALQELDRR